jgi:hypothetical protein
MLYHLTTPAPFRKLQYLIIHRTVVKTREGIEQSLKLISDKD